MRILILSCNTGGGHNACATAIQEAFVERGHHCEIADSLYFVSDKLSKFMSWGHTAIYRHAPNLMRAGYGFAEKHPSLLEDDAAVYKLLTGGTEELYAYIRRENYDTVVCTHVFSGLLLHQMMKDYSIKLKSAMVATDYTCSPGVAKSELDYYFIPAASLKGEFLAQGVPARKIIPSGIPIRRGFYQKAEKREAKLVAGIDPTHTHLLMMCGSMGCGPLPKLAKLLSQGMDESMELSIVCGTNEKLYAELTEVFGALTNIHIYGFVKDMIPLVDSADLCLTKPGGLTTTEALAKRLPMVLMDTVAGCEEYNLNFFVSCGGAVTAKGEEELSQLCLNLLRSDARREQMAQALNGIFAGDASAYICKIMCKENER